MSTEYELRALIHKLYRQFPDGVTTYSPCFNSCGNDARGGDECRECLREQVAEMTGSDILAKQLIDNMRDHRVIVNEMCKLVEIRIDND